MRFLQIINSSSLNLGRLCKITMKILPPIDAGYVAVNIPSVVFCKSEILFRDNMKPLKLIAGAVVVSSLILSGACTGKESDTPVIGNKESSSDKTYLYDWESLKQAPVPDWFRDAKFGIFIHWGPYSVPGWSDGEDYSEWYSTRMYRKPAFIEHHQRNWGELSDFGYKEFIPMFKGEKFNPDEWASLFKAAGAKYVIPTGEHHDGFVMWDTDLSPWNSVAMGPKLDFIGSLGKAVRAQELKYGVSYHRERHWGFYTDSLNTYKESPEPLPQILAEIEATPKAASLYGPFKLTEAFMQDYKARFLEIAEKYRPDFLWIDDSPANSLFPDAPAVSWFINKYHLEMIADYLNMAEEWGKPVYFNNKRWKRSNYPAGAGVDEKDYLRIDAISKTPWHSSGGMDHSYGYDRSEDAVDSYKSVEQLVETLVDVVSKNGNFLLDIGPKADGAIPENQKKRLLGIGEWLQVNGEAIYGTRPWVKFGEDGVRFTRKGDVLYAILFDWPAKPLSIDFARELQAGDIVDVMLLGDKSEVAWRIVEGDLQVKFNAMADPDHAHTLKIVTNQMLEPLSTDND